MNHIHPTAVIGARVELGAGNVIGPYAVLVGDVVMGDENWVGPFAAIGTPSEIRGAPHGVVWADDASGGPVRIGDRNVLRESIAIHGGSQGTTLLGDDCFLMNKTYVAHDCQLADGVTMAAGVVVGGHTHVGAGANLGLNAAVHQHSLIGPGVMLGMGSIVRRPVPPHALAYGCPARVEGVNRVGMQRAGLEAAAIEVLADLYADGTVPEGAQVPSGLAPDFDWWQRELTARQQEH